MTVKAETRGAKPGLAFVTEVLLGSDLCTAQAAGERLLCARWRTAPGLDPAARSLHPAKSHRAEQDKALCSLGTHRNQQRKCHRGKFSISKPVKAELR